MRAWVWLLGVAITGQLAGGAVQAAPDLKTRIISVWPQSVTAGDSINIRVFLSNYGSTSADLNLRKEDGTEALMLVCYLKPEKPKPVRYILALGKIGALGHGSTHSGVLRPRIPADMPAGHYSVCCMLDPEDRINEAFEDNNQSCKKLRVGRED